MPSIEASPSNIRPTTEVNPGVEATPLSGNTSTATGSTIPSETRTDNSSTQNIQVDIKPGSTNTVTLHSPPEQTQTVSSTNIQANPKQTQTTSSGGTILEKMMNDGSYRSSLVSRINGILHAVASVTAFAHGQQGPIGLVNKFFDKMAFGFTKFIAPILSYGLRAWDAVKSKNLIEAFIKILPPVLMPLVGDANVDVVYGLSTGMNVMHDMAEERLSDKSKKSADFAQTYKQKSQSYGDFAKMIFTEVKNIFSDFVRGKLSVKAVGGVIASVLISGGALPIMLFARKARDTALAKILGLIRNLGGILGDIFFIFDKEYAYRRKTGLLCAGAGVLDIAKRWVGEKWGQIFIHLAAALNVSGYAVWNAHNGNKNAT